VYNVSLRIAVCRFGLNGYPLGMSKHCIMGHYVVFADVFFHMNMPNSHVSK